MNRWTTILAVTTTLAAAGTVLAADAPGTDVVLTADLTAVIALQEQPCGKVVSATPQGQED